MAASEIRNKTAIVGVGYTDMVRRSDRSLGAIASEAAAAAIRDAGLTKEQIDGYVGCPDAPNASAVQADGFDQVSAAYMVNSLGLDGVAWSIDVGLRPTGAVAIAAQALISGLCTYALVVRAMYNPTGRYAESRKAEVPGPDQFSLPYGLGGGGGRHAQMLQRYMHDYGATREELFEVVGAQRRHAQLNPVAYWRDKGLSLEDYMNARWVYEPMCLFDCDIPVTGAGAVVVTAAERARDLPHRPAFVTGYCNVRQPADTIFDLSGVDRKDVQALQVYDGFSHFVWQWLEKLAFCEVGEAHVFARQETIALGGTLPVNTFGGNLGEGRLHAMGHVREGVMQVMGRCGERQVPELEHCLVAAGGVHVGVPTILMLSAG